MKTTDDTTEMGESEGIRPLKEQIEEELARPIKWAWQAKRKAFLQRVWDFNFSPEALKRKEGFKNESD